MIVISHRANLEGPSSKENSIENIYTCLARGIDVEIDVWWKDGNFFLGHDQPETLLLSQKLLLEQGVWCHAKNLEAAEKLRDINAHYFWHQEDDFTITSRGFFWTYPGRKLGSNSIAVLPELDLDNENFHLALGVCTDYPLRYISYE